ARLGNGGRGLMPAGRPHAGVRTRGVSVSMSGWQSRGLFGSGAADAFPPRGLTGYSVSSSTPGAMLALTADQAFTGFGVCVAAGPQGPRLALTLGGERQELDFTVEVEAPDCRRFRLTAPADTARLDLLAGQAVVTGWWLERPAGVIVSNLGVPGSQLQFLGRADTATIAAQLKALPPDLIILAFGTNEGFAPAVDAVQLESQIREQVARLRGLAGPVPMLMLGPPDAASRNRALAANAPGEATDCNPTIRSSPGRLPVDGFDIPLWNDADGNLAPDPVMLAGPAPRAVRRGLPLFVPPGLAVVQQVQRRVAGDLGIAFWDWRARQGGACAAIRWMQDGLMGPDFIHYSPAGGAEVARLLLADLDAARTPAAVP
uniref:SGNH/GDSL hydrolase family protein n=1 Tax=Sandarakinorhabdus rubra TaxID=2672568 RepID=UPI00196A0ECC